MRSPSSLNRRFLLGVRTVNSPRSRIVRVYDAGHGKSGVFHSAEWHVGDWLSDGIREAWLMFFIWVALNRRFLLGVRTVNSPQSHIVRVYDAGLDKSGVFHSAEWHVGDWLSDGIREAWLMFFI
ncbi:hypothetical protein TNCV_3494321 [Trichonephila clavipes]|nr:hypothetical protein TNCV_3494321 [Trichonephila clavipes]